MAAKQEFASRFAKHKDDMAEALNLTLAMPHLIDEALAMQKKAAVAADATDYMEILHL